MQNSTSENSTSENSTSENSTSENNHLTIGIAAIVLATIMVLVAVLLRTYVISYIWSWYIVPFFHVQQIPLITAFGMSLLVSYLVPVARSEGNPTYSDMIIDSLGTFLAAYIGTFFM